jgi:hypothetical protein
VAAVVRKAVLRIESSCLMIAFVVPASRFAAGRFGVAGHHRTGIAGSAFRGRVCVTLPHDERRREPRKPPSRVARARNERRGWRKLDGLPAHAHRATGPEVEHLSRDRRCGRRVARPEDLAGGCGARARGTRRSSRMASLARDRREDRRAGTFAAGAVVPDERWRERLRHRSGSGGTTAGRGGVGELPTGSDVGEHERAAGAHRLQHRPGEDEGHGQVDVRVRAWRRAR